jgi:hypothetical protein
MGVCYSGEDQERPAMPNSSVLDRRKPHARRVADLPAHFRERVLAALPGQVERIVLFGSQARAEAHGESDWDFAVFLANRPSEEDRRRIRAIGDECGALLMRRCRRWSSTARSGSPGMSSRATFVTVG